MQTFENCTFINKLFDMVGFLRDHKYISEPVLLFLLYLYKSCTSCNINNICLEKIKWTWHFLCLCSPFIQAKITLPIITAAMHSSTLLKILVCEWKLVDNMLKKEQYMKVPITGLLSVSSFFVSDFQKYYLFWCSHCLFPEFLDLADFHWRKDSYNHYPCR